MQHTWYASVLMMATRIFIVDPLRSSLLRMRRIQAVAHTLGAGHGAIVETFGRRCAAVNTKGLKLPYRERQLTGQGREMRQPLLPIELPGKGARGTAKSNKSGSLRVCG